MSDKPVIFISYSHLDEPEHPPAGEEKWLTFVQRFLKPAVKDGRFEIWVDRHMAGGADWNAEIEQKLRECDVFVLLVSAHSMASDYVVDKEIAIIRERQENGEKVHFYPIMLTPTPQAGRDKVKDRNLRPKDGVPLSRVNDRSQDMSDIADEIAAIVEKIAKERDAAAPKRLTTVAGVKVEIGGLPETPYVNLVGRDDELKRLDDAWDNPQINIVSLVAEGGAGKSSLLNEWLVRMQARGYAGAGAVLGWSFYSQGSKERATSAEGFLDWAVNELGLTLSSNTSTAKATAIAEALASRRILLALDGVEPLQHGPGPDLGKLKDEGMRELVRRVATNTPSAHKALVVLTTRAAVTNIDRWRKTSARVIDVDKLGNEAGIELLKDNGVWGTAKQLKEAVEALDGRALALSLLAGFLAETQNGDVRRRDHIKQIAHDDDDPRHAHAKRVIKSYAVEWLAHEPVLDAIMSLMGLFDRPADAGCLAALRSPPVIADLTEPIHHAPQRQVKFGIVRRLLWRKSPSGANEESWNQAVARLRAARLLLPPDPKMPDALDAHPLVREWFGERLKATNETAWRASHARLYEHLRDTTREGETPTLEDLSPLYQAIAHGCQAGLHRDVLQDVYLSRICRRRSDGELAFYSTYTLGAIGSDLAAVSWFFEKPYEKPLPTLPGSIQSSLLADAAFSLRALGRFSESIAAQRASLRMSERAEPWEVLAARTGTLSEIELIFGEVKNAIADAARSVEYSDRSKDEFRMAASRSTHAAALFAGGDRKTAEVLFVESERLQKKVQPEYPLLYSLRGFNYGELLLANGEWASVLRRATQTTTWTDDQGGLLDRALVRLLVGRASLEFALINGEWPPQNYLPTQIERRANAILREAIDVLRAAGTNHHVPRGLFARAAFRRSIGDWSGAARDLDEVEEIAEPGPMRLHLCDMALGRARLAFTRIEAFAPLSGMLEKDNPPKPVVPSAEEVATLKAEAETQIKIADDYIQSCGYHRRDEELAELKQVLSGEKKFAELPPRV